MSGSRPEHVIDPVCGMTVTVARAEADGLLIEHEGRTYAFCGAGCQRTFLDDPKTYGAEDVSTPTSVSMALGALPVIDEGMRRWYESCSCCLSEAFPEIKARLDAERAALAGPPVAAGICEVAEAHEAAHEEAVTR